MRGWAASAEIAAAITRERASERGIRCSGRGGRIRPIERDESERRGGGDEDEQSESPSPFHGNGAR